MWIWCKIKKNMPKIQIPVWNVINRIVFYMNGVSCGKGLRTRGKVYVYNKALGMIHIGENVRLNSAAWANPIGSGNHIWIQMIGKDAVLTIGNGSGISNTAITCMSGVEIGNDVMIGSGVKIYDTDFHSLDLHARKAGERGKSAPIRIKDGVFIGTDSIILKGVTIGENSVVGAGAVVTKNIPAGQVWGGNPAKYIKDV